MAPSRRKFHYIFKLTFFLKKTFEFVRIELQYTSYHFKYIWRIISTRHFNTMSSLKDDKRQVREDSESD